MSIFGIAQIKMEIKVGTFSLATEADWGQAFELKNDGSAIITLNHDTEEFGKKNKNAEKKAVITGKWKETSEGIEISYENLRDRFRFEKKCKGWSEYPCFRRLKDSVDANDEKHLSTNYPFINWDWKN